VALFRRAAIRWRVPHFIRPALRLAVYSTSKKKACLLVLSVLTALVTVLFGGCARIQDLILPTPNVPGEWNALLAEVRTFEKRVGFTKETENFKSVYQEQGSYTMCGYAPRFQLPYSYQDPLIRWADAATEEACRAGAGGDDMYFTTVEAVGEIGTAVTSSMLEGKLDRFLYLVIHEDCHDQFDLPYGIEEALCNLIGYKGMAAFTTQKYGALGREHLAIRRYVGMQSTLTRAVVDYHQQVEQLYAQHARKEITADAALQFRARIFTNAERTLGWNKSAMNNVGLANEMTYSRHYPLLERVYEAMDGDLARTVAFFKSVDQRKPTPAQLKKQLRINDEKSVEFVRAYEAAIVRTIESMLIRR